MALVVSLPPLSPPNKSLISRSRLRCSVSVCYRPTVILPLAKAAFKQIPVFILHNYQGPPGTKSLTPCSSALSCRSKVSRVLGFLVVKGLGNNTSDYDKFKQTLNGYGVPTVVANVSRVDWLRNAAGLVDPNYWRGTLQPRPVLDWYLKRVEDAVNEAKELANGTSLSIIGHSAGGWLARLYMEEFGVSNISLLVTLGTPHLPPPKGSPGVIDQTRGLLYYVEEHCSKAVYNPQLRYVCIAGRYIEGSQFFGNSSTNSTSSAELKIAPSDSEVAMVNATYTSPTFRTRFIGQGYKQVCGSANVWGDGVVPEIAAHLKGALNISFDGVYHSPVGSDDLSRPWYGSPAIAEQWIHHLLD